MGCGLKTHDVGAMAAQSQGRPVWEAGLGLTSSEANCAGNSCFLVHDRLVRGLSLSISVSNHESNGMREDFVMFFSSSLFLLSWRKKSQQPRGSWDGLRARKVDGARGAESPCLAKCRGMLLARGQLVGRRSVRPALFSSNRGSSVLDPDSATCACALGSRVSSREIIGCLL